MKDRNENVKNKQERLPWIDAVRSFACLCVICIHAPSAAVTTVGTAFVSPYHYLSISGGPILFFMISGALILNKPKPPMKFLKQRFARVVPPMFFWTVAWLFLSHFFREQISWTEFWHRIVMIPISPQLDIFWFIYVLFGIYLLTPILATWLERCQRQDLVLYLLLWGITLFIPYLKCLHADFEVMVDFSHGYLYYFWGYLWIAVMGYYLRHYVSIKKLKWWHFTILAIVLLMPVLLYQTSFPHDIIQSENTFNAVALCIVYFIIFKHLHYTERMKKIVHDFAEHSFGIYLVHIFVLCYGGRTLFAGIHAAVQIPLIVAFTAVLSYLIVHLISKLPYSKYIVGL